MANKGGWLPWLVVGFLVLALVYGSGFNPFSGSVISTEPTRVTIEGQECGSSGTADLQFRMRDTEATGATYLAAIITAIQGSYNGIPVTTVTGTSDGLFALGDNILNCGETYSLLTVNTSSATNATLVKCGTFTAESAIERVSCLGAAGRQLTFTVNNMSYQLAGTGQDNLTATVFTITTNDVLTVRFDVSVTGGNGMFGAYDRSATFSNNDPTVGEPIAGSRGQNNCPIDGYTGKQACAYVCIGANPAVMSNSLGVALAYNGVVEASDKLPRYCGNNALSNSRSFVKAYAVRSIATSDGTISGTFTINADLGNPGANDDVRALWVDVAAVRGADGTVRYDTADDSNADIGLTNRYFEVNLA